MIYKGMNENKRAAELKEKIITIVHSSVNNHLIINEKEETINRALKRFAKELNLIGSYIELEGLSFPAKIKMDTIGESIRQSVRQRSNLLDLGTAIGVFPELCRNAVLLEAENYSHLTENPQKGKEVINVFHYVSAFYDRNEVYPVKIIAEERRTKEHNNVKLILTVDKVLAKALIEEKRGSFPNSRDAVTCHEKTMTRAGDSGDVTSSFAISLPHFIKNLNSKSGVILQNIPDEMLSDEQLCVKYTIIKHRNERNGIMKENFFSGSGIQNTDIYDNEKYNEFLSHDEGDGGYDDV